MLNFTVGPAQSEQSIRDIGSEQVPYFRTEEFSALMKENEKLMLEFTYAREGSRAVFLTGSGTAAMEAAVINAFNEKDKVLVIVGGSFGERFSQICDIHHIPHKDIRLEPGKALTAQDLSSINPQEYTGFLINIHETSTGVLYDLNMVSDFCKKNDLFLVVDAISSFLSDDINLTKNDVGIMFTGSQKALACPPGISALVLSPEAIERVKFNQPETFYLDLKAALRDGERGQTPFTPAVSILRQINRRLNNIKDAGGVNAEKAKIAALAADFRRKIQNLPFELFSNSMSNTATALKVTRGSAYDLFLTLKDKYGIWVCPNGGALKDTVFRVGHIGDLTFEDNTTLVNALAEIEEGSLK